VSGKLFYEDSVLWYEGTFRFLRGGVGYPVFEGNKSFVNGLKYNKKGSVKVNNEVVKIYE
jgi:hypothetical protein